jgi:hypothetical protein
LAATVVERGKGAATIAPPPPPYRLNSRLRGWGGHRRAAAAGQGRGRQELRGVGGGGFWDPRYLETWDGRRGEK